MKKTLLTGVASLFVMGLAFAQNQAQDISTENGLMTNTIRVVNGATNEGTLYSNGAYYSHEDGGVKVSLLDPNLGMNTLGFGHAKTSGYRVADDWEVTSSVSVESMQFYAYQTGSPTTSTINFMSVAIWNGEPNAPGSQIVWGGVVEDVMDDTEWSGAYRRSPGTDTTRPIMISTVGTTGLVLQPGIYWLDWNAGGTMSSGPWAPPVVIQDEATTGNAKQYNPDNDAWNPLEDSGSLTPQGLPFEVNGSVLSVNDHVNVAASIYPTVTSSYVNISARTPIDNVVVYDLLGKQLMNVSPKGSNIALDVSSLSRGTYIVKATIEGQTQVQRIIRK